jgi:hypothetical protein
MIGVGVRVQHGVDQADPLANELDSQFGRGVDEQVALREPQDDGAAGAAIPGVWAGARGASAADQRDAVRRSRAQENELA